jgi:hypothetical protein
MNSPRRFNRRSFLGLVTGGAVVGGAALVGASERAEAMQSDTDHGLHADRKGQGRTSRGEHGASDLRETAERERERERARAEHEAREQRERRDRDPPEHPNPEG